MDVFDPGPPRAHRMPAAVVARGLGEVPRGVLTRRRRPTVPPVIRVADRFLTGRLDLRGVTSDSSVEFVRCRFEEPPDLRRSVLAGVDFVDCLLPGLSARGLVSSGDVSLARSTVEGPVDVSDADIARSLVLTDGAVRVPGGLALEAERVRIGGALVVQRVSVEGGVRLTDAWIGGRCAFNGASLSNPGAHALVADGARVHGAVSFDSAVVRGTVVLSDARVELALSLRGAAVADGRSGTSLVLDRIKVAGDVRLDRGFTGTGVVRLADAVVGGALSLSGGRFEVRPGDGDRAVLLEGSRIAGGVVSHGARVEGGLGRTAASHGRIATGTSQRFRHPKR